MTNKIKISSYLGEYDIFDIWGKTEQLFNLKTVFVVSPDVPFQFRSKPVKKKYNVAGKLNNFNLNVHFRYSFTLIQKHFQNRLLLKSLPT